MNPQIRKFDVVIVGAGHAGAQMAILLRQMKYPGSILIVGDETGLPYERPPLTKEYLSGEKPIERLLIRSKGFWEKYEIEFCLGHKVELLYPAEKMIRLSNDTAFAYEKLVWATGGSPRRLNCPGGSLDGIHVIRNRADVDKIRNKLDKVTKIIVIGGGYIGLEAAAVLREMGKDITILEASDRVLSRVAGNEISQFFETMHRHHGVNIRTNQNVIALEGEGGSITGVVLDTGDILTADMVIIGIGIIPSVAPIIAAGAKGENGVDVNEYCQTALPDVFAIGDCAAHKNIYASGHNIRLESVQNANDQAMTAAKMIMNIPQPYKAIPWFWSNQYDLKLQTVGLSNGFDETVIRGNPDDHHFSVIYLKDGHVIALDCVNSGRDWVQGRKLVEACAKVSPARLADPQNSSKTLI